MPFRMSVGGWKTGALGGINGGAGGCGGDGGTDGAVATSVRSRLVHEKPHCTIHVRVPNGTSMSLVVRNAQ